MVGYMDGWLFVWLTICMVGYMYGWLYVWLAICLVGFMYGWLYYKMIYTRYLGNTYKIGNVFALSGVMC